MIHKKSPKEEQVEAENLGFTDKPGNQVEDAPLKAPVVKTDEHCVVDGCAEKKAQGQTHVCAKHVRTN